MKKDSDTFVPNTKKFKYLNLQDMKLKWSGLIAPLLNHPRFNEIINLIIDYIGTCFVLSFVVWCFGIDYPIRKGFGIAVLLAIIQYYIKWFYSVKPKIIK